MNNHKLTNLASTLFANEVDFLYYCDINKLGSFITNIDYDEKGILFEYSCPNKHTGVDSCSWEEYDEFLSGLEESGK